MKKSLGKLLILLSLLQVTLSADSLASYKLSADKTKGFVKEAIEITFKAQQKDHTNAMFFFLKPKKSEDYVITLLRKKTKEHDYHNSTATFTFILFPLKAKKIVVGFDFYVKTTSDQALTQAYVSDHDEGKGLEGDINDIAVKPLFLNIQKLSRHVDLVGDFQLHSTIDTQNIRQYDNINLHYKLSGSGYNDTLSLFKYPKNTEVFSDIQRSPLKLNEKGYMIKRDYTYAISAKKDFTVPSVTLQAYSPSQKKFYTLKTPSYDVKVTKIDPKEILDKEESPKKQSFISLDTLKELLTYLFIFISGYFFAKLTDKQSFSFKKEKQFQDIKKSADAKELVLILLNRYSDREIEKYIKELEVIMHEKGSAKFYNIRKRILEEFM